MILYHIIFKVVAQCTSDRVLCRDLLHRSQLASFEMNCLNIGNRSYSIFSLISVIPKDIATVIFPKVRIYVTLHCMNCPLESVSEYHIVSTKLYL